MLIRYARVSAPATIFQKPIHIGGTDIELDNIVL